MRSAYKVEGGKVIGAKEVDAKQAVLHHCKRIADVCERKGSHAVILVEIANIKAFMEKFQSEAPEITGMHHYRKLVVTGGN